MRSVWGGSGLARASAPAGGRSHRRQLARQPHQESAVPVPQLPLHDGQLPGARKGTRQGWHFMSNGVQYTRERLSEAAARCSDIDEVIAFFGTQPYGQLRRHLFRRFDHFGIDVSHMPRERRASAAPAKPATDELLSAVE